MIDDERAGIHNGPAGLKRLSQGAVIPSDIGLENGTAGTVQGLLAAYAGGFFGGTIERRDAPIQIDGENTFVDRIENNIAGIFCLTIHAIHSQHLGSIVHYAKGDRIENGIMHD